MKSLIIVGIVLILSLWSPGQSISNCTTITMTKTEEMRKCNVSDPGAPKTAYPLTDTVTFLDECTNDATTPVTYYSQSSAITGTGGCMYYRI